MKENEARDIIAMARGATTQWPVDDDTVTFWMHSLRPLDAEMAAKAVFLGVKTWDRFPAWSSFYEAYRFVQRRRQMDEREQEAARQITEDKRRYARPEWTWVWQWCRWYRDPREERAFPQQEGLPELSMTTDDYMALHAEWVAAGLPKERARALVNSL